MKDTGLLKKLTAIKDKFILELKQTFSLVQEMNNQLQKLRDLFARAPSYIENLAHMIYEIKGELEELEGAKQPNDQKEIQRQKFMEKIHTLFNHVVEIQKTVGNLDVAKLHIKLDNLLKMGIVHFFTFFEAFNRDFCFEIFLDDPSTLSPNKTVTRFDVLKKTREELVMEWAREELEDMETEFEETIKFFKKIRLNIHQFPRLQELKGAKFLRNDIVHNGGNVSKRYVKFATEEKINPIPIIGFPHQIDLVILDQLSKLLIEFFQFVYDNWDGRKPEKVNEKDLADAFQKLFS